MFILDIRVIITCLRTLRRALVNDHAHSLILRTLKSAALTLSIKATTVLKHHNILNRELNKMFHRAQIAYY